MDNEIIEELRKNNPYYKKEFPEMSNKEIGDYVSCLDKNGFSVDRIHGDLGRRVWVNCCDELKKIMGNNKG